MSRHNSELYDDTRLRMIEKGVIPCPDAMEPWLVSAAETDQDVDEALRVFEGALSEIRSSR